MRCSKSSSKREVHSDSRLPQKQEKSDKHPNLLPERLRKRRAKKTQSQKKERNDKRLARRWWLHRFVIETRSCWAGMSRAPGGGRAAKRVPWQYSGSSLTAASGFAGHYSLSATKHLEPRVKQAFQNLLKSAFSGTNYRCGFEPQMTKWEAALILGVRLLI